MPLFPPMKEQNVTASDSLALIVQHIRDHDLSL